MSEEAFLAQFGGSRERAADVGARLLREAVSTRDPTAFANGLAYALKFGAPSWVVDLLIEHGKDTWHERHEDVVSFFAWNRVERAVDALAEFALTEYPYRSYDEFETLGVRCTYALADIGTLPAVARLEELAGHGVYLATDSRKQLVRLAQESDDPAVRAAAKAALRRLRARRRK